ncbi:YveK family protein [Butyrivibrio sp. MC2013]|uniref:YveK family protein n=1 Tax=Butyrivibrio sp. MC2013 TaxID=1280686 RepID=UPI0004084BB5|nr:Wzz/FepE/Etk N-terminal domain-containing protein [Butyrivibrio sp. MC2013]
MSSFDENLALQRVQRDEGTIEIDLGEILGVIFHRLWIILIVAAIFGGMSYAFSKYVLPEKFQSTTKIYVLDKEAKDSASATYTDLQVGSQLTKDYAELITGRYVLETVMKDMKLDKLYSYEEFLDKVDVVTPTDTRIVAITVTDTDPATAQLIADAIREVASEHITKVMAIDAVNVAEKANFPLEKSSPHCIVWALLGAMAGFFLMSCIFVFSYLSDDTIKTEEDIEKYLGTSALGLIPFDENVVEDIGNSKKKAREPRRSPEPEEEPVIPQVMPAPVQATGIQAAEAKGRASKVAEARYAQARSQATRKPAGK